MPFDLLITCKAAQIKRTDQRMFGWPEKCFCLKGTHGSYTILDWLQHIQHQVSSSITTRNSAYVELCDQNIHYRYILDYVGFASKCTLEKSTEKHIDG